MSQGFSFDSDKVDDLPANDLLPVGWYPVQITKAELAQRTYKERQNGVLTGREQDGNYINVWFKIVGEKYANKIIFQELYVGHPYSEKAANMAMGQLKKIVTNTNAPARFENPNVLVDQVLKIHVVVEKGTKKPDGSSYDDKNGIKDYARIDDKTKQAPAAAAPAAQKPAGSGYQSARGASTGDDSVPF